MQPVLDKAILIGAALGAVAITIAYLAWPGLRRLVFKRRAFLDVVLPRGVDADQ